MLCHLLQYSDPSNQKANLCPTQRELFSEPPAPRGLIYVTQGELFSRRRPEGNLCLTQGEFFSEPPAARRLIYARSFSGANVLLIMGWLFCR